MISQLYCEYSLNTFHICQNSSLWWIDSWLHWISYKIGHTISSHGSWLTETSTTEEKFVVPSSKRELRVYLWKMGHVLFETKYLGFLSPSVRDRHIQRDFQAFLLLGLMARAKPYQARCLVWETVKVHMLVNLFLKCFFSSHFNFFSFSYSSLKKSQNPKFLITNHFETRRNREQFMQLIILIGLCSWDDPTVGRSWGCLWVFFFLALYRANRSRRDPKQKQSLFTQCYQLHLFLFKH